jgi:hypothetical protein
MQEYGFDGLFDSMKQIHVITRNLIKRKNNETGVLASSAQLARGPLLLR